MFLVVRDMPPAREDRVALRGGCPGAARLARIADLPLINGAPIVASAGHGDRGRDFLRERPRKASP